VVFSISKITYIQDFNTCNALERIFAALDTYAEMLRLDPTNLVSDTPYNDLIFRTQVRITQNVFLLFSGL